MRNAGISYSPTDVFYTFPFPMEQANSMDSLGSIGKKYHEYRSQMMLSRTEGLTTIYNHLHNTKQRGIDITNLREMQREMDNTVAAAYGWQDLDLGHGFHETPQGGRYTLSEHARREVVSRLLQLNHERYEEEIRMGLHEKKKIGEEKVKGTFHRKSKRIVEQDELF
jgi:hypothetical protein